VQTESSSSAPRRDGTTGTKRLKLLAGWDATNEFLYPQPLTLLP
jgi:hypothetical protein